jgi:hypothetical protein
LFILHIRVVHLSCTSTRYFRIEECMRREDKEGWW